MIGIVERRLLAAKDHERVVPAHLGQAAVGKGAEDLDPRARFVEGDAHLAVMGDRRILDDGDVHDCPLARAAAK